MSGRISETVYYNALAQACNLSFAPNVMSFEFPRHPTAEEIGTACRAGLIRAACGAREFYLTAPYGRDLVMLLERLLQMPAMAKSFVLTSPSEFRKALLVKNSVPLLDHAVNRLQALRPADSARRSYDSFFRMLLAGIFAITVSVLYRAPLFAPVFGAICAALYLLACYFRILAYNDHLEWRFAHAPNPSDKDLPSCSVLVPVYKEAKLVPQLLGALANIDYPRAKLDILILIEQDDTETAKVLMREHLPPYYSVITVPKGEPRTKPRALQVGLSFARGDMVTIFDAEDIPHPQQLRHAAKQLYAGGARLACVQAQLRIDNADKSWLSKQFALEYASLFTVFLPSLAKRGLPLLLGGTSNYFRTQVLREVGGWDPWNVTEDADLGIRLARAGYHVGTFETPTEEEAPVTLHNWLRQRMRWQKGWMQTFAVHFSQMRAMRKEMGLWKVFALTATLGVSLLSVFAYPLALVWVLLDALLGLKNYGVNMLGAAVFGACLAAFIGGNLFPLLHMHAGAKRAGFKLDAVSACTVWAYWLLISVSAYCALYDLARSPYRWFKTEHFGRQGQEKELGPLPALFRPRAPIYQTARQVPRSMVRFSELARPRAAG
jgi:cellulose synthase/poly-beta-1,6-N-acetylglucosamine synthase-like glycosyltransferase